MKSLQVLTPSKPCIFHCPFCISKSHQHDNQFKNNYEENHSLWKENLTNLLKKYTDLKYIVITGTNEPMQDKDCVEEINSLVKQYRPDIQVEIQTRFYLKNEVYSKLDVVAYSISNYKLLEKIEPLGKKNRFVLILTDDFNHKSLDQIIEKIPSNVSEITFKVIQSSNGINLEMDKWILNHKIEEESYQMLKEDIVKYQGNLSIRLDENCMDSLNRYKIFREDGYLYDDWEEIKISKG